MPESTNPTRTKATYTPLWNFDDFDDDLMAQVADDCRDSAYTATATYVALSESD